MLRNAKVTCLNYFVDFTLYIVKCTVIKKKLLCLIFALFGHDGHSKTIIASVVNSIKNIFH